jgi:transposase
MDDKNDMKPGATEGLASTTRAPNADGGGAEAGPGKRLSARRKLAAVQRLMRGESLEALSRELNLPAHRLSEWRDRVLIAAESALKERERDARDEDIARLKAKVGEITMANELL